eukprot:c17540_g1_i1.p1 GENE.c17540_g1_i1~~c17540_g1_i1.p1  ORF type:complete len:123 (+),score=33.05 c17540_g1_i1:42-371(+)
MSTSELAYTYAALILHDAEAEISAANLNKVVKAAGIEAEGYWAPLFAKLLKSKDLGSLITNVGAGAPAAAPAPTAAAPAAAGKAAPAAAAPPPVEEKEEEEAVSFDLFD